MYMACLYPASPLDDSPELQSFELAAFFWSPLNVFGDG
jgi:hypothetical protein